MTVCIGLLLELMLWLFRGTNPLVVFLQYLVVRYVFLSHKFANGMTAIYLRKPPHSQPFLIQIVTDKCTPEITPGTKYQSEAHGDGYFQQGNHY